MIGKQAIQTLVLARRILAELTEEYLHGEYNDGVLGEAITHADRALLRVLILAHVWGHGEVSDEDLYGKGY